MTCVMNLFSEQFDEYLVEIVSKNPPLYDSRLKSYRDIVLRENIWENISKQLNKSSYYCKKRWKCIRDSYQRIKRKNKLPTGSAAASKSKKWPLFERLCFLEKVPTERKSICSIEIINDNENDVSSDDDENFIEGKNSKDSTNKELSGSTPTSGESSVKAMESERSSYDPNETAMVSATMSSTCATEVISSEVRADDGEDLLENIRRSTRGLSKKKKQCLNSSMQMVLFKYWKERDAERRAQIQTITSILNQDEEPDVDEIKSFCSHVGTMLRKLSPALRIQAKTKVFSILTDFELMSLNQSSDSNSSSSPLLDQNSQSSSNSYWTATSNLSQNSPLEATDSSISNSFTLQSTNAILDTFYQQADANSSLTYLP